MKRNLILVIVILSIGVVLVGFYYGKRWIGIDTCLDHGGRWNYETDTCENEPGRAERGSR